MGICPVCKQHTLIGHYHAIEWRVDLVIDDPDACDPLPIPFQKDHGCHEFLERGKHAVRIGRTCHMDAKAFALRVFPEARVTQLVRCDITGEPVKYPEAAIIPV